MVRTSVKQASPVKKVFADENLRTKSGSVRVPLNLDVSQVFQKHIKHSQATEPLQRKKSLTMLSSTQRSQNEKQLSKSVLQPNLQQQIKQQFKSTKNDFVFKERDKFLRSVINAAPTDSLSQPHAMTACESDATLKPNYFSMVDPKPLTLQSFAVRKLEHLPGYLQIQTTRPSDEELEHRRTFKTERYATQ
jgi:hypothetical protein